MRLFTAARTTGFALLLAGSALALACGGGASEGGSKTSEGGKTSEGAKSTEGAKGGAEGSVAVALSEWGVKPASASVKAGKVDFKTTNSGSTPHELVVIKTDVAHDKLEKNSSGVVDETKYKPLGRTKQLDGGKTEELELDVTAGKYVLLCNVAGHYDLGMHTAFTVN